MSEKKAQGIFWTFGKIYCFPLFIYLFGIIKTCLSTRSTRWLFHSSWGCFKSSYKENYDYTADSTLFTVVLNHESNPKLQTESQAC